MGILESIHLGRGFGSLHEFNCKKAVDARTNNNREVILISILILGAKNQDTIISRGGIPRIRWTFG